MSKEKCFDDNLKDLQCIINKLESSESSLEESMILYKDAFELSQKCYEMLENAQQEIITINNFGETIKES